ncbi:hypothetical protein [Alistipes sp.]|uniref:hypothetical protein n=1 Tax=Alistipes sp. TaxID=1872444 RepID=UPI003AF045FE
MLNSILSKYLLSHKRLVVPQLGAFLVKEPGVSVLFSELLKRDDGVLRGLLREEGLGELEAAGEIDRFVFEVRHAVEHGKPCELEGFGVFSPGPNATIAFEYRPAPEVPPQNAADVFQTFPEGSMEQSVADHAATQSAATSGQSAATSGSSETTSGPSASTAGPSEESAAAASKNPNGRSAIRPDKVAEAVETAFADPRVSPSVKMNPEPYVRGLKYGKPHKTTDAYRYVDRPPRRRFDRFLWLAILAAGLAVAAIAFGYWHEMQERKAEASEEPTGQALQTPATDAQPEDGQAVPVAQALAVGQRVAPVQSSAANPAAQSAVPAASNIPADTAVQPSAASDAPAATPAAPTDAPAAQPASAVRTTAAPAAGTPCGRRTQPEPNR